MTKTSLLKSLISAVLIAIFLYSPETNAQLYDTQYEKNKAVISYSDKNNKINYLTDHMLSGFNRKKERFIYKIPLDTLMSNLLNRDVEVGSPFERNYLTVYIRPKSHPIDLSNFDGESQNLKCEVEYQGRIYNETAQFRAFFNDDDQVISTSFSVRIMLRDKDWFDVPPEWGEYTGEIAITTTEALVPVKTNY